MLLFFFSLAYLRSIEEWDAELYCLLLDSFLFLLYCYCCDFWCVAQKGKWWLRNLSLESNGFWGISSFIEGWELCLRIWKFIKHGRFADFEIFFEMNKIFKIEIEFEQFLWNIIKLNSMELFSKLKTLKLWTSEIWKRIFYEKWIPWK